MEPLLAESPEVSVKNESENAYGGAVVVSGAMKSGKSAFRDIFSKFRLNVGFKRPKWNSLPYTGKIGLSLVPATVIWSVASMLQGRTAQTAAQKLAIVDLAPSLLAAYGKSIGLIGIKDLYDELKKNLGVKLTLTRTYQVFSLLGYLTLTVAELYWTPAAGLGRIFFLINGIYTWAYAYMLFLTMIYNSKLEEGSRAFDASFSRQTDSLNRQALNLPALLGWCALQTLTGYVWLNEARMGIANRARSRVAANGLAASSSAFAVHTKAPLAKEAIAVVAFLLTSLGAMRSGFRTSMTSIPDISPFAGTLTLAMATLLSATALVPMWNKSSIARIYLAGHASVIYSVLLNSYYAFKQEKLESKQRALWSLSRRAKL
jgi:hypothetical protein